MRFLPIGIDPNGSFILDTGGTTVTIPATLLGIKLLARILSEPAGRLSEPGAPSKWDVKQELMKKSSAARMNALANQLDLEDLLAELDVEIGT